MPTTEYHEFNVPEKGTTDWHKPLNENFKKLESRLERREYSTSYGNFEPVDGAKYFNTQDGRVFIGNGSEWYHVPSTGENPHLDNILGTAAVLGIHAHTVTLDATEVGVGRKGFKPLDVKGQNNWNVDNDDGDVRIGTDDYRLAIGVATGGAGAGSCNIRAKGGTERLNLGGGTNGHTVQIESGSTTVNGDLDVSGNKNFVQTVDTDEGDREVAYTASEGPTPRTEVSGVAELEGGRTEVDLPEHFGWVTSEDEDLVVETTPYSVDSNGLAVVERSTDRLVLSDLEGEGNYEFAYTVRGTREGHADKQVVREPSADATDHTPHAPADD